MASTLLYLVILVVTGTLWEESSALVIKNLNEMKKLGIWEEKFSGVANTFLNSKSLQKLDEDLKVMMGGILKLDIPEGFTWKELKFALDTNPLMRRQPHDSASKMEAIAFCFPRSFGLRSNKIKRLYRINVVGKYPGEIVGFCERVVYYPNRDYTNSRLRELNNQLLPEVDDEDFFSDTSSRY